MVAVLKPITARVITRPTYLNAPDRPTWLRINHARLWDYWVQLDDGETSSEFLDFAKVQYDLYCDAIEEDEEEAPRSFRTADEAAAFEAGVPARGEI